MSRLKIIELDNKASHVITQRVKARSLKWRWWIKICFPKDGILTDNSSLLSLYGVNMVKKQLRFHQFLVVIFAICTLVWQ